MASQRYHHLAQVSLPIAARGSRKNVTWDTLSRSPSFERRTRGRDPLKSHINDDDDDDGDGDYQCGYVDTNKQITSVKVGIAAKRLPIFYQHQPRLSQGLTVSGNDGIMKHNAFTFTFLNKNGQIYRDEHTRERRDEPVNQWKSEKKQSEWTDGTNRLKHTLRFHKENRTMHLVSRRTQG